MEGGYTFIRRYTLPVIRDDEGIVPYGFYRDPRMNGGGETLIRHGEAVPPLHL